MLDFVNAIQNEHVCLCVERPVINKPYKVTYLCSHSHRYFKAYYDLAKTYVGLDLIERVVSGSVSVITLDLMGSTIASRCSYHLKSFNRFIRTIMVTEGAMHKLTPDQYAELYMFYIAIGSTGHENMKKGAFDWSKESWHNVSIGGRNI